MAKSSFPLNMSSSNKHSDMKSTQSSGTTVKSTDSQVQQHRKKKSPSALSILKDTLKLKSSKANNKNYENNASNVYKNNSSKLKEHNSKNKTLHNENCISNNGSNSKRLSTQRITLFYYNNVRVMSYSPPAQKQTGLHRQVKDRKNPYNSDETSLHSLNSNISVSLKPLSLVSHGPLEIYQMRTPSSNFEHPPETMNYLSLGRQGNIIHPILPKLRITKSSGSVGTYSIFFYNPQRFWKLEFLSSNKENPINEELIKISEEFEREMSQICNLKIENDDLISIDHNDVEHEHVQKTSKSSEVNNSIISKAETDFSNGEEDDDDEQLAYLLEYSSEGSDNDLASSETTIHETYNNLSINKRHTLIEHSLKDTNYNTIIDIAFKKALHHFPSRSIQNEYHSEIQDTKNKENNKRYSSYIPLTIINGDSYFSKENNDASLKRRSLSFAYSKDFYY